MKTITDQRREQRAREKLMSICSFRNERLQAARYARAWGRMNPDIPKRRLYATLCPCVRRSHLKATPESIRQYLDRIREEHMALVKVKWFENTERFSKPYREMLSFYRDKIRLYRTMLRQIG